MKNNTNIINIRKEKYYHLSTNNNLQVGDILNIGDKYNNFYHEIYNTEHINTVDANMIMLNLKKENKIKFNSKHDFNIVLKTINDSALITRELMFEETRKEIDDNLPSRLRCLFVCKTKDELNNWINIFKRTNKKNFKILELELSGKIFCGDAYYILRQNISLNKKKSQAKNYWTSQEKDKIYEYLFEGKAIVKKIINIENQKNY